MATARYAVKSATLTFGGTTYEMAAAPAGKSETREAVEVTALSDQVKQFIKGALKETGEFTVTLYQGSADVTADDTPAALTISVTLSNGVETDITQSVSYAEAIVTGVSYGNIDASGDRKATYDVTFRPSGAAA